MAINCAAIPEALLENELFGHEKGAFTGAAGRKIGKAEMAHRGTLFLDEIGDLPLPLQGKILRLVQEKQFERVGGVQTLTVDVRVVAATNRDLKEAVAAKQFREDLFFRLSVFPVEIPPLRRRRGDILLLAEAFLERYAREMGRRGPAPHGGGAAGAAASTPGRATCASCRTAWSGRPSCATAARSGPSTCAWRARRKRADARRRPGPLRAPGRGRAPRRGPGRGGGDPPGPAGMRRRPRRRRRAPGHQRLHPEPAPARQAGEAAPANGDEDEA